eukprot:s2532_g32.t1
MAKELKGLTQVKAGRVMKEKQALDFCKKHGIKVITCRWVTPSKPEADEGVRARIVVKDFAKGKQTARQEGISSPTPSIESLRILLGAASGSWTGGKGFNLYAIDVSRRYDGSQLYDPDIQSEVPDVPEVRPPTTEVPPAPSAESRMEEPEIPVLETQVKPKVKAMPKRRKASAKAVAVKRMPRPTVKKVKVKQEAAESVRGTFRARQTENNRKRRLARKARQRESVEYFKRARQEEESRPAEVIAVE